MALAASWERMAPREKRLVALFGGVFATMASAVIVYLIWDGLSFRAERNQAVRDALESIEKHRDEFMAARRLADIQKGRISSTPGGLQLVTLVENAAKEVGVPINETSPQQPQPQGKKYVQQSVEVKFRQVDLVQLSKFLKRIESGSTLVYASRLLVRAQFGQPAPGEQRKLDAEVNVAGFEVAAEAPAKKQPKVQGLDKEGGKP